MSRSHNEEYSNEFMGDSPSPIAESDDSPDDRDARSQGQKNKKDESAKSDITGRPPGRHLIGVQRHHQEMQKEEQKNPCAGLSVQGVHAIKAAEEALQYSRPRRKQ
nr:hypothetical protein [Cohnella xylanilytica]